MIIFLRHAQAENNTKRILAGRTEGVHLTKAGIEQAESIAKYLKSLDISAIYSSPIERASHTAEIVAKNNSLDYELDDRITEIDMGRFTRMNYDDMFAKYGNIFLKFYENDPVIAEHEVETFLEVQRRILDMVTHVVKKHKNENVILVTHMDPIKSMLSIVMDLKPKTLFELIIANASLTIIKEHENKFSLSAINAMDIDRYYQTW
ncbi:histidine phosphatase family protein [Marine Group I thaumarchaeote]|jgi:probable phosphoglycerate mutase|uniref:Histidine phosphatase family protein n=1 Tax=Marine Group I thaumarchaeote TaxID=2511932 RepID=A0A7K4MX56_9ARCH|nr:histidine phosphatase family protein [Marine Group I thaumarchaeote]